MPPARLNRQNPNLPHRGYGNPSRIGGQVRDADDQIGTGISRLVGAAVDPETDTWINDHDHRQLFILFCAEFDTWAAFRWWHLRFSCLLPAPKTGTPIQRQGYAMRPHHRLQRTSIVAGIGVALLFGAHPAAAAPTDTVFAVPVVGASVSATGLPSVGAMYVTASTDPAIPGVTQFLGDRYCCVFIHWRNISTGAAGTAYLGYPSVEAQTGSGIVVAAVTVPTGPLDYPAVMIQPGSGAWTVP